MAVPNLRNFVFIGEVVLGKEPVKSGKSKNGNEWKRLSLGIKNDANVGFVELMGMKRDTIITFTKGKDDEKGERKDIKWADRFNGEILDEVANFKKYFINLDEKKEFIAELDVVEYIQANLDNIKGKRLVVSGQTEVNEYKGKTNLKFIIQSIRFAKEDEKDQMEISQTIYFNKESLDKSEFKDTKRAYVNGWVKGYNSEAKRDNMYPYTFVLDASKVDFTHPKAEKMVDFLLKQFTVKGKAYHEIGFTCKLLSGAEKEEITYDDLTDYQKQQIDLGLQTLEQFKKALGGSMYGEKRVEIRLIKPHAKYSEGAIETDLTDDDFIIEKAVKVKEVKAEDLTDKVTISEDDLPFNFDDFGL